MIREISMPALSSTMESGKIVSWLKNPGDLVQKGENLLVVESDKADMDVESFHAGIVAALVVPAGEAASVGAPVALIAETEAEVEEAKARAAALAKAAPAAKSSAPAAAKPTAQSVASPPVVRNGKSAPATPAIAPPSIGGRIAASPRAKRLAAQRGVDLTKVVGSGPNGRIVAADVERLPAQLAASSAATPAALAGAATPPPVSLGEVAPFNTLQQAVVRNMSASLSMPTFHVGYVITTDKLDAFYRRLKPKGVTMTALLAKAVAVVLEQHPILNASYTDAGTAYKAEINVAIAVAMDGGGLITPVLQNANHIDIYELSRRWKDLVARSRSKQLQPEEYSSGTFTLSNLGMFGVDRFDAILPPNQGSILAIGASRPTVVATADGAIAVKPQMQVNITCDHRVIYGADAAAFLKDLAVLLETQVESLAL
ncbi:MAG: dihydrolipoamide acetyltransferase family protein [Cyanobacteria bacterium P01_F01_bin.33]